MATKYKNPPVVYAVAKLIYAESIGKYGEDKYEALLSALKSIGFDSYSVSKVMGIQLKQSDNQFSASPANSQRVGYFSPNRKRCAIVDENSVELRIAEYSNHTTFLDEFGTLLNHCQQNEVALGNKPREVELHYVDLFVPDKVELKSMFSSVSMPVGQFYAEDNDAFKVGVTNFTRVLQSGREKVSVSLEQLFTVDHNRRKYLPDSLVEPDSKLRMPLNVDRLFANYDSGYYAIVHTACGALVGSAELDIQIVREKLEYLYSESRKTFDHMIEPSVCNDIWQMYEQK
ncbi:TIGR04255 family protein [Shewanella indica]|uniref:TIGR04255 family protein n=1 Tax=Shewanella TaxID=22 RepID=UPI00313C6A59